MKKLFISIFTCVFALFALGTSTFAWFSMSKQATVQGMQVKAYMESDLLIAEQSKVISSNNLLAANATDFKSALTLEYAATNLTHASSINGINFFVENGDIDASGALSQAGTNPLYAVATNSTTEGAAQYYKQFDFIAKYTAMQANETINLTALNVAYALQTEETATLANLAKALRVAFVVTPIEGYAEGKESFEPAIDPLEAVSYVFASTATHDNFSDDEAAEDVDGLGDVSKITETGAFYTVPVAGTNFFKVSVVIWLEGEDESCKNAVYTVLKGSWAVDFKLEKHENDTMKNVLNYTLSTIAPSTGA